MNTTNTIYFAGGCFWGVEAAFQKFQDKGVEDTTVGYMGGTKENPTYDDVITGKTGHYETVKVVYNVNEINLERLLDIFFQIHDPTQTNGQANDIGSQYLSAIFVTNTKDKEIVDKHIEKLDRVGEYSKPIITAVRVEKTFYEAEKYHQDYLKKNPSGYCNVDLSKIN